MVRKLEIEDSRSTGGSGEEPDSTTGLAPMILQVASHRSDECTIIGNGYELLELSIDNNWQQH